MPEKYGWSLVMTDPDGIKWVQKEEAESNFDAFIEGQEEACDERLTRLRELVAGAEAELSRAKSWGLMAFPMDYLEAINRALAKLRAERGEGEKNGKS